MVIMNKVLHPYMNIYVRVYLDKICIFSDTTEVHMDHRVSHASITENAVTF